MDATDALSANEKKLRELVEVFLAENAKINLSAFRTPENCWVGNVLDSLAALELFNCRSSSKDVPHGSSSESPSSPTILPMGEGRIMDLGTGGGFPLLPLAICMPERSFTGTDAVRKKIDAVSRICTQLKITNVDLLVGRSEELGRDPAHRERYDIVLARGVAEINVLLEYASPFVKKGGFIVLWKSMTIDQELKDSLLARAELSCHLIKQHGYELPGNWLAGHSSSQRSDGWGKRQLLVFEKASALSDTYPRPVGMPKKHPLT